MNIVGWLGAAILTIASIPQTIKVLREGHAKGMSWAYIVLLLIGFACMLIYSIHLKSWPLSVSYSIQIILFSLMGIRKIYPLSIKKG